MSQLNQMCTMARWNHITKLKHHHNQIDVIDHKQEHEHEYALKIWDISISLKKHNAHNITFITNCFAKHKIQITEARKIFTPPKERVMYTFTFICTSSRWCKAYYQGLTKFYDMAEHGSRNNLSNSSVNHDLDLRLFRKYVSSQHL